MQKPFVITRARQGAAGFAILAAAAITSCGGPAPASAPAAGGTSPATSAASPAATASSKRGVLVMDEPFATRIITDAQQGGMAVGVVSAPARWRFNSTITWTYGNYSNPVTSSISVENPANVEAVYSYPLLECFDLRGGVGYYQLGVNYGGMIYAHPQAPLDTLAGFIQRSRAGVQHLQFVGSKDLPGLAAALNMPASPDQRGLGIKVTYDLDGQPVEEEFYAVYYSVDIPFDGRQGRTWQTNWGLAGLHSFRAPAGALDTRRPIFAAIAKSFRPNPAWQQRLAAINAFLTDQFNQQMQAGYDAIDAAARLSRAISANNDAMIASIDRQLQASSSRPASSGEARSSADKFDDYIRGVETVDDPYYGTSQHAITEDFHWTDGYGNYRQTNDPTADPNRSEAGNWQLMRPIR